MSSTVVDAPTVAAPSLVLAAVRSLAQTDPGRVALVGDDGDLTYADLWRRAHEDAEGLGAGVVTVPAVHDPETVVALLATWLAGGVYCPMDPAYPADHAAAMRATLEGEPLGDAAYVLFTSGSSGLPKPVAVPHRALDAVVPALVDLFGITADDRVLQCASLSWDTSLEELLPTLAAGATVLFGSDAYAGSLPHLLRLVERERVSVLDLPTAFWHELVLHLAEAGEGLPDSVRLVVIGGEAADPARLVSWHGLPGTERVRLLNTYGATETALITHAIELTGGVAPIGRPLPHVVQRVTDEGELLVGGPSLALGYVGIPEITGERFVDVDGERYFRTGDLVTTDGDGLLHHVGRLDAQVKVRGIRVDPAEVEAHLRCHPHVADAAVTGVTLSDRTVLAAYVVAKHGRGGLLSDLRRFLRARAPSHLCPARITLVPELARTRSGKVDRLATHDRYQEIP
jgi:non-ribosomal peptide synthetase component F